MASRHCQPKRAPAISVKAANKITRNALNMEVKMVQSGKEQLAGRARMSFASIDRVNVRVLDKPILDYIF